MNMNEESQLEPAAEQVFDYFLQELVTGQSPPDLSTRIVAAWAAEQAGLAASPAHLGQTSSELVHPERVQRVLARPLQRGPATIQPKATSIPQSRPTTSLRRNVIAALLALGACGLLTLLSWRLVEQDRDLAQRLLELAQPQSHNPSPSTAAQETRPGASPQSLASNGPASHNPSAPAASAALPPANSANSTNPRDALEPSSTAFPLDRGLAAESSPSASLSADPLEPVAQPPLDSQQIVAQIDQRLDQIWQELSVTPSERMDDSLRAQRISLMLTGQLPSQTDVDLDRMISQATASLPFARQWADQFVTLWLAGANVPADDLQLQTLKKHFADSIYRDRPWNAAAFELLGGPLATDTLPENSISTTFVSALAGDGNHRLVARIGSSFLDVNLSCVRCHEANPSLLSVDQPGRALPVGHFAERQTVYWSLTAMLQGIDAHNVTGGQRVVVDRQAEQLAAGKALTTYYDLLDGRLQAAEPRLPDGQAWESISQAAVPRQALAVWLSQSPTVDAATVNQVWNMVFGQPLVPRAAWQDNAPLEQQAVALTQQARTQRLALQQLLTDQYRAHNHDLKQLISWIVRCDAFRRQPTQLNRSQWLAASSEQLQQWQLAQANFATGAKSSPSPTQASLESSLLTLLQLRERSGDGALQTTLAQPAPSLAPAESTAQPPASPPQTNYFDTASGLGERLLLDFPPPADVALVEHLLATRRLSWENCVQHVAWLAPHSLPDSRVQYFADELLRQHNGDARAALLDLLWAVKH